jgi:hypothetical protein
MARLAKRFLRLSPQQTSAEIGRLCDHYGFQRNNDGAQAAFWRAVKDGTVRIPAKLRPLGSGSAIRGGGLFGLKLTQRRGRPPKPTQEKALLLGAMLVFCKQKPWGSASNLARILKRKGQYQHLKHDTLRKDIADMLSFLRELERQGINLNFVPMK